MKFIHHMKDGSIRDSIEGVVITNEEFYQVLARILEERPEAQKRLDEALNEGRVVRVGDILQLL